MDSILSDPEVHIVGVKNRLEGETMNNLKILIVDDDELILELLTLAFERCGLKVFKAENGNDAWNLFKSEQMNLVLTDIYMPGLDGKELSRRIRNMSPFRAIITGF
jgi:CheY-like chemotaxis protein